jgi:hypothetical protein
MPFERFPPSPRFRRGREQSGANQRETEIQNRAHPASCHSTPSRALRVTDKLAMLSFGNGI